MIGSNFERFLDRVHGDCVNAKDAPGGELTDKQADRLLSAVYDLNGEAEKLKAEEREALLECFAMRAPACPDWFQPDTWAGWDSCPTAQERVARRIGMWPWAYAEMVLAARPGGAK